LNKKLQQLPIDASDGQAPVALTCRVPHFLRFWGPRIQNSLDPVLSAVVELAAKISHRLFDFIVLASHSLDKMIAFFS